MRRLGSEKACVRTTIRRRGRCRFRENKGWVESAGGIVERGGKTAPLLRNSMAAERSSAGELPRDRRQELRNHVFSRALPEDASMSEGVAAGLGVHAQAMGAFSHFDTGQQTPGRGIDGVDFGVVAS